MTNDLVGCKTAVGTSWKPTEQQVTHLAHSWKWVAEPTLHPSGHGWSAGRLLIDGTTYEAECEAMADEHARVWERVTLLKADGVSYHLEVNPAGQATCDCPASIHHPSLTCRHRAVVPLALAELERLGRERRERANEMADTPELDFDF